MITYDSILAIILGFELLVLFWEMLVWYLKIICKCIIIQKGEDKGWWKGLVPFYNRLAIYNLAFNPKSAVLIFILDLAAWTGVFITSLFLLGSDNAMTMFRESIGMSEEIKSASLASMGLFFYIMLLLRTLFRLFSTILHRFSTYALAQSFGRGKVFCVWAIFFPMVMSCIVAFGRYDYTENVVEVIREY